MLEEYGVVACPRCQMARGVRLSQKSTTCARCGATFELRKRKILYRARDAREAGAAVAEINRRLMQR
ncbi:MAG: DUF1922 domain-containing protein [Candidatus Thermoplasmatota archaeon]|nr:DUF1922 domain-containing protein [Candidatus Thermoplasmatota archaeon]MDD5779242.1 DUF1922 domain-containing protein [Candidatus Thermoplasmatota archaeon]